MYNSPSFSFANFGGIDIKANHPHTHRRKSTRQRETNATQADDTSGNGRLYIK
jgi:hypothetical protein